MFVIGGLDILDFVATAQHYSLPTRLIDWTRNPFVALFFAISQYENPDDDSYKIYYTNLDDHIILNNSFYATEESKINNEKEFILIYAEFLKNLNKKEKLIEILNSKNVKLNELGLKLKIYQNTNGLIFYEGNQSNERLNAQQGLFSIPVSLDDDNPRKEIEKNCSFCELKLDRENSKELVRYLNNMNYNSLRLFPDVENISKYIVNEIIEK